MMIPQMKKKIEIRFVCKLQGHVKLDCYRLNDYPPDWKFKKKHERAGPIYDQGGTSQMQGKQVADKPYQGMANQMRLEQTTIVPYVFAQVYIQENFQGPQELLDVEAQPIFTPGQY